MAEGNLQVRRAILYAALILTASPVNSQTDKARKPDDPIKLKAELVTLDVQIIDKKTQRVAWVVEDKKNIIFDTGLYNLTKDETPVLVHMGKDKTEQWLLVRLKQPIGEKNNQ